MNDRATRAVDANLFVGFGNEEPAVALLLAHLPARIEQPMAFAVENRIVLIQDPQTKAGIGISLGGLGFEDRAVERSSLHEYAPGIDLRTCSAEDLIVYKAFANRDIDWHDVKGILIRQQGRLDFNLIERELAPLAGLREQPAIPDRWGELRRRYP